MKQIEAQLSRAVELNPSFAEAYGVLAEVRAALKQPLAAVAPLLSKAVALDPSDPWIRISAARALWRANSLQEARKVAQVAADLATDDQQARAEAQRLLAAIPATATPAAGPAASVPSPSAPASAPAGSNPNALMAACQANDVAACRDLFPLADKACAAGDKRACLVTAVLQVRGRGVDKDAARASATFEKLCDDNMYEACTQWAVALASDSAKPDLGRARQLLTKSCDGGFVQACEMLKGLPK